MSSAISRPGSRRSATPRGEEFERALTQVLFGLVPAVVTAFILLGALRSHGVAYDFHWSYYPAARRLLDGGDVYASTSLGLAHGVAFAYPALAAVLLAPFALMGHSLADHVYMVACLLMVPGTLWLGGMRDWRVYGIALLWLPVIVGWQGGNVSIPLALLSVLAWRWRGRPLRAGVVVAIAISVKPFIWPLALWLIATRRWRAAGWALASGLTINLLAWAIVGFNRIDTFLRLSAKLVSSQWRTGYGILAVAHHLGAGRGVGELILLVVSSVVAMALLHSGLVKHGDRRPMVLAVALALVASPLVWSHYFVLLLLPLVVYRPRLSPLWAMPLAMCVCTTTTPSGWQLALAWLVAGVCLRAALRSAPVGRWPAGRRLQQTRPKSLATTG
jgi:hypothetical protein